MAIPMCEGCDWKLAALCLGIEQDGYVDITMCPGFNSDECQYLYKLRNEYKLLKERYNNED